MSLSTPPERFRGLLSDFVVEHVVPNWPSGVALTAWLDALLLHHAADDAVCIVREPAGSRGVVWRQGALRVVGSDDAATVWCVLRAIDATVAPSQLHLILEHGELPVVSEATPTEREEASYGGTLTALDRLMLSAPGLSVVAIGAAGRDDVRARSLRNLAPVNHFLWPSRRRFEVSGAERETIRDRVQLALLDHLGSPGRVLYERYLDAVGGTMPDEPGDPILEVSRITD